MVQSNETILYSINLIYPYYIRISVKQMAKKKTTLESKELKVVIEFDKLGHLKINIDRKKNMKFVRVDVDGERMQEMTISKYGNDITIHEGYTTKDITMFGEIDISKSGWIEDETAPDDVVSYTIKPTRRVNLSKLRKNVE